MAQGDKDSVIFLASDVVALFPSLNREKTTKICAKMVEKGVDLQEMLLYLGLNQHLVSDMENITPFLPVRKKKKGKDPSMANEQVRGPMKQCELKQDELL